MMAGLRHDHKALCQPLISWGLYHMRRVACGVRHADPAIAAVWAMVMMVSSSCGLFVMPSPAMDTALDGVMPHSVVANLIACARAQSAQTLKSRETRKC
jgi:hypothetical protein